MENLGITGACVDFSCRANAQQPKLFVGMILILIFAEALALYGLIGAALLTSSEIFCHECCDSHQI